MSEEISIGDTVTLKSGDGPRMTVLDIFIGGGGSQLAACAWFVPGNHVEPKRDTFPVLTLKKVPDYGLPAKEAGKVEVVDHVEPQPQ